MPLLLFVLFIVVPIIELAVILQVGQVLGIGPTLVALVAVSLIGAWLVRREGTRAWSQFRTALSAGRLPTNEVLDGALVLLGGALLLTPGFVTDLFGLSMIFPPTRALYNRALRNRVRVHFLGAAGPVGPSGGTRQRPSGSGSSRLGGPGAAAGGPGPEETIDVEVVDVQRNSSPDAR